jgi:hypothetical protein
MLKFQNGIISALRQADPMGIVTLKLPGTGSDIPAELIGYFP